MKGSHLYSRFFELVSALGVLIGYFFRRRKTIGKRSPRRILIVQNAKMGDMVCTTPMFRAVKKHLSQTRLAVVGNAVNKELLADHPDVDEYIVFDQKNLVATLEKIRRFDAEFACVCTPDYLGLKLLMLARIPVISATLITNGRSPHETLLFRLLRKGVRVFDHAMGRYAPKQYLRLLEPAGIHEVDTSKSLVFSQAARERVERDFHRYFGKFNIGISPSAGNRVKEWPAQKFGQVIDGCLERFGKDVRIFIVSGAANKTEVDSMKRASSEPPQLVDTSGKLSIDELKAFISSLDIFVAVDTGPIYIAEAFGVATIDIVGPVDENEQPPKGDRHILLVPERERPAMYLMNAKVFDPVEARRQAEAISVKEVLDAIECLYIVR